jgi:hypothetical protein
LARLIAWDYDQNNAQNDTHYILASLPYSFGGIQHKSYR